MNWYVKISQSYMGPETWGYWIDPNGKLLPCNDKQGHKDVLRDLNIPDYNQAFNLGYIRLVTENQMLFVNNNGRHLTEGQVRTINQLARSYNFVKFVTDGIPNDDNDSPEFNDTQSFKTHLRDLQHPGNSSVADQGYAS